VLQHSEQACRDPLTVFIAIVAESTACSTQFRPFSGSKSKPNEILTSFGVIDFSPRKRVIVFRRLKNNTQQSEI
jgi:hypothetical protein